MLENYFLNLPIVEEICEVCIQNRIIRRVLFKSKPFGSLLLSNLGSEDSKWLYDFYFHGLSEQSRILFPPYPLFSPYPESEEDLNRRIREWQKEEDWVFFTLKNDTRILGVSLLKRMSTSRPTSGLAIMDKFHKMGLGFFLQKVIEAQARLLKIGRIYVTLAQDNMASLNLHRKCGFIETGRLVPHCAYKDGEKIIDRYDKEMTLDLS